MVNYSLPRFRTYQAAIRFYRECEGLKMPYRLRDQLLRAASSIVLNLAEGSAKESEKDRLRFYRIALGSLRECQAAPSLARSPALPALLAPADGVG